MSKEGEKLYNSLGIPPKYFNPYKSILNRLGDWNIIGSARGQGKTTNLLLAGMCENVSTGVQIQYIRQYDDMLTPSKSESLFDVILSCGYISKITDEEYNSCEYRARRWYYTRVENGEIVARSEAPFMVCLAINKEHQLRSSYNAPEGDFIIVDEFMRADGMYLKDEFIVLNNLLSTIIRDRITAHIFLVGNLVDIACPYFAEMGISDAIRKIKWGEYRTFTNGETVLTVYLLPTAQEEHKERNKYFSLWGNSKMTGITGAKGIWALKMYPHAPHGEYTIIDRATVEIDGEFYARELRQYAEIGLTVYFYRIYAPLKDKVVYTHNTEQPFTTMRRYGMGYSHTDKIVSDLIHKYRVMFSDNETGEIITRYIRQS